MPREVCCLMSRKTAWLAVSALLSLLLAAACGDSGPNGSGSKSNANAYDNDGYLGITNANPNLQTGPSYHTYQVDTDMMRQAVGKIGGVRNVRIVTNGANANVELTVDRNAADPERIREEALKALQHEVPRYNFKVTVRTE